MRVWMYILDMSLKGNRKFLLCLYVITIATVMVFLGYMDAEIYFKVTSATAGAFILGNGIEHFTDRGKE